MELSSCLEAPEDDREARGLTAWFLGGGANSHAIYSWATGSLQLAERLVVETKIILNEDNLDSCMLLWARQGDELCRNAKHDASAYRACVRASLSE